MKLVQICADQKGSLDEQTISTLVEYVLSAKKVTEGALPKAGNSTGAYYEFDTKITFPRFIEYSYTPAIMSVITRPSSLRYSFWTSAKNESQRMPGSWKPAYTGMPPMVIHGIERDSNSPDLNTGVYHEYNLKRTLILLNHRGRQVLLSISKQMGKSDVGKKGFIVGNDTDWHYYYTGETGSTMTGLGWAKSYIYDYFAVSVYVEANSAPASVRTGVFQWLKAGWSGINFVNSNHMIRGMKRFARDCRSVLESPRLPAPNRMVSAYYWLWGMPADVLHRSYSDLRRAQWSSALKTGKISQEPVKEEQSISGIPKEQMVEELMLEYLKSALGKTPLLKLDWDQAYNIQ
ncbi:MAG TPA: hypothetical protein VHO84_16765 [Syntrophorhabdaceae bacterium]|nr:hypothetical protein [Syntrophorhabdaceae bacterium]